MTSIVECSFSYADERAVQNVITSLSRRTKTTGCENCVSTFIFDLRLLGYGKFCAHFNKYRCHKLGSATVAWQNHNLNSRYSMGMLVDATDPPAARYLQNAEWHTKTLHAPPRQFEVLTALVEAQLVEALQNGNVHLQFPGTSLPERPAFGGLRRRSSSQWSPSSPRQRSSRSRQRRTIKLPKDPGCKHCAP